MDFLQKGFYSVFELPLPRNALIRKKSQEQKSRQARAASKNTKTKTRTKNKSRQKTTDAPCVGCGRLWTCHCMWASATGCGVFLHELVPSGGPFIWCFCETFVFAAIIFFKRKLFYFLRKTN
jgi:hypothetical protein